jgi:hypothetical protein
MPMQAESLEVLEGAQISAPQARAIVRAIEIEIAGAKDTLATKHDLLLQSQDSHRDTTSLREDMAKLEGSLRGDMAKLEGSLRGDMAKLERSLRADMATLEASVRNEFAELRTTMAEWRGELRAEIQTAVSGSLRQMYMALLGQMAVLLGFAYFFATHVR